MRYLIIGLGIYGSNLARDLTDMGHEVIGADRSATLVEAIKEYIATAYILDTTDEAALSALPLRGVDLVIVAIGENFGASIKTVALLKKLNVKHIYARAADDIHQSILQGMHIDRILKPEQRAARDLSQEMALGHSAEALAVTDDSYVMRFGAPDYFIGMAYPKLNLKEEYGLTLVTATRPKTSHNMLGMSVPVAQQLKITDPDEQVQAGDVMVCFGTKSAYKKLLKHIQ